MVNKDLVKQLNTLGYSKNVAEKSLFMTQAKEVGAALDWIEKNQDNPDFEEQLFIVNPDPKQTSKLQKNASKKKYTKEEAREMAKEMQKKSRERMIQRDKEKEI